MKLGARIFKTGLAVMLSLYIATWFGLDSPMFAAIAAMFAVQPSIYRTFQTILEQIQANVIGAVIAVIFVLTFGHDPFVVGVVVIITIAIILKLKLEPTTIPLGIVTIISIMELPSENFIAFAGARFLLTLIGVLAAFIVNLLFIPPRYETKLYNQIVKQTEDTIQWITLFTRNDADSKIVKQEIVRLNEQMIKLENLYLLYKEERNYFLKNRYAKGRKLVIFRQMIAVLKNAQSLLKNLDQQENELTQIPEKITRALVEQIERLTNYNDRILLRYAGKITTPANEKMINELSEGKHTLMQRFLELNDASETSRDNIYFLLPTISRVIEYEEKLRHLDQLLDSFFNFHQLENKVTVGESQE